MSTLTIEQVLALIPDEVYSKDTDSNVYKAMLVKVQIFEDLFYIAEQIRLIKDITTVTGKSLENWAADYQLKRDGLTDDELRIRLATKISSGEYGTTIPGIIKTLIGFVDPPEDLMVTERSDVSLGVLWDGLDFWDGSKMWSGSGSYRPRTVDVSLDFVTGISDPVTGAAIDKMKNYIKSAGITMSVEYF